MRTRLARLSCGLYLAASLTSASLPAQEPEPNPVRSRVLQPAPHELPNLPLVAPEAGEDTGPRRKPIVYSPVTSQTLQDRLALPESILDSKNYPKVKAELLEQRREDFGFREAEPPANWYAVGDPYTTVQAPLEPLTHNPLYFEEPQAERYGYVYSDCVQPFVSASHFYLRVPLLSAQMLITPPHSLVTPYWPQIVDPAFEYDQ